jgi:tetratricopeptide (TPR) repeat protein
VPNKLKVLLEEIHRRSLWQILIAYAAGSWLVLGASGTIMDVLGLPDWVPQITGLICLMFLPLVLATAVVERAATKDPKSGAEAPSSWVQGWLRWKRVGVVVAVAFALLATGTTGYMGMRVMGIGPVGTLMAKGLMEEGALVVLADFESTAGSAVPGDLVTEALRVDLSQSPTFDLLDPSAVALGLARMVRDPEEPFSAEVALELATREGGELVVSGEVGSVGNGFLLTARILSAEDGTVIAPFRESAKDLENLIEAIDAISAKIRGKMGEALRSVASSEPLHQATTTSLDALRKYTYAIQRAPRGTISGQRAIEVMEEAIALDTTFAEAYRCLSILINNYGGSMERRATAATQAFRLRDRLPLRKRFLVEASYHNYVTGEYREVARAYRGLLEMDSLDAPAAINLAGITMEGGDYAEAADLLRAHPKPGDIVWTFNLTAALSGLGKYDEAEQLLAEARTALPGHPYLAPTRAMVFSLQGREEEALEELAAGKPFPAGVAPWVAYIEGVIHARAGRFELALAKFAETDEVLATRGAHAERMHYGRAAPFLVGWMGGDRERGMQELQALTGRLPVEEMAPVDRAFAATALIYALVGAGVEAETLLDQYVAQVPVEGDPAGRSDAAVARALVRILDGARVEESQLRPAVDALRTDRVGRLYLGHGYESAGDAQEAIGAYEAYLSGGYFDLPQFVLHLPAPVVHERLGRLYEAVGATARAVEHYRAFVTAWENADPSLQPRVERARESIERLAPDPSGFGFEG